MSQSRRMSFTESAANVAIGYALAILTQMAVFPLFGIHATATDHAGIAAIFTAISIVRSYAIRRLFNRMGVRA